MSSAERAWKKWGERNPYYGVLAGDEFRKENLSREALKAFFETGEKHVAHVFDVICSHLDADFRPKYAIDYGCGTGRLVIPLARRCGKVLGVDISSAMLEEARQNSQSLGVGNVAFMDVATGLDEISKADFIHSYIVFQHIPVSAGMKLVARMAHGISRGGVLAIHMTFWRNASALRKSIFWMRHKIPGMHLAIQALTGKPLSDPPMQMNHYSLNRVIRELHAAGIGRLHVEVTDHGGHLGVMLFGQKLAD